ncbi:MAG TPA: hypothetical protein VMS22_05700 [Candidatus Eisenbacteria bacterium]|nr:hypothetical protein [Candidatus Eisenbacteria bacterium]
MAADDPGSTDALQLEHAELPDAPLVCAGCGVPIGDTYFEVNGRVVCPSCQGRIVEARAAGSGAGRLVAAALLGVGAAALGAIVWYGIREVTGYEVGLVAIGVGLLVGVAVQRGSGGRGGVPYQILAVALTYLSIVSANAPYVWQGIRMGVARQIDARRAGQTPDVAAAQAKTPPSTEAEAQADEFMHHLPAAAWLTMGAIVLGSPFMGGFKNAIGWLIIFFGLQQAWRLTRRAPLKIAGPFALSARPASGAT